MSIAIVYPNRDVSDWVAALQAQDSSLTIEVWPEIKAPELVELVLCWNHPAGIFEQFPNLKCISSLGAGVNHLLKDPSCPTDIPLIRLVDPELKQSMAEYVLLGALEHFRRFREYRQQQISKKWRPQQTPHISEIGIGIMGCGELGQHVGHKLAELGFQVYGWSRTPKKLAKICCYSGDDGLAKVLSKSDILVCLLPMTKETENILNRRTFSQLPQNAYLINVARGAHLVDVDLVAALDSGQLSGALLDVFRQEPLAEQHPFWSHPKISITPHIASITSPASAAVQIVENYRRALARKPLANRVDLGRGY